MEEKKGKMITDWLNQYGNPDIEKLVEQKLMDKIALEEAAKVYGEPYRCPATNENEYCRHDIISAFNNGVKYQAERMYSEEDVIKIVEKSIETGLTAEYLLLTEQFKKK